MPYVALQQLLDEANAWGVYAYEKGTYVEELSDDIIEVITEQVPRKNSPHVAMLLYRLDGAFSQVDEDDTAFSGGRSPRLRRFIIGDAPDSDLLAVERELGARLLGGAAARTRSPTGTAISTARPTTRATGCEAATGRRSTSGWPRIKAE